MVALLHPQLLFNPTCDGHYSDLVNFEQTPKQQVSCDDKEGHYIVTPDDIIYKRCKVSLIFTHPTN